MYLCYVYFGTINFLALKVWEDHPLYKKITLRLAAEEPKSDALLTVCLGALTTKDIFTLVTKVFEEGVKTGKDARSAEILKLLGGGRHW